MADESRSEIIKAYPVGKGLDAFRASFKPDCEDRSDALDQLDTQRLALDLFWTLGELPAAYQLPSQIGHDTLHNDILQLLRLVLSDDFDNRRIKPFINIVLADKSDEVIWDEVYRAVTTECTSPPQSIKSSFQQTQWFRNTNSFANTSEYRKHVDSVLKRELGSMYIRVPNFHERFFGGVADLEEVSKSVFKRCMEGDNPLFREGWNGWPKDANENDVLSFIVKLKDQLVNLAEDHKSTPKRQRKILANPNKPIEGSVAERKMGIGFVNDITVGKDFRWHWSQILVPGELKSNPSADTASKAWLDLGTYAREVLGAQDTRRFVLGFTLCGSLMRVWEFDRLGAIASEQFDINQDGLQFVSTILGFLWMNEEELGFDPTIISAEDRRYIEIERSGQTERLIIDGVMMRAHCVAGRGTTCWRAHREGDPRTPLVIKDSWQYPERDEEGKLLCEATGKGVVNVARYYHHETVCVRGKDDDIRSNVRRGLDITKATNYRRGISMLPSSTSAVGAPPEGRSNSTIKRKQSSNFTDASLPARKRICSTSPTKAGSNALPNRVHRRIIVRDYGKPIYAASSRAALLEAVEGCIEGHQSLYTEAGMLHRDISINNLLMNEDDDNPSWPSFVIDLDLAIKEQQERATRAQGMAGTRAFMAIGVLLEKEKHSFMHDLESFFWVLFWICIHCKGPNKRRVDPLFEKWNYVDTQELAILKVGTVYSERMFNEIATEHFTEYHKPLVPWLNRLRSVVFPGGSRWENEDRELYSQMKEIICQARMDLKELADK
ncbi:hypothetical protein B7494_g6736 [Chlorociboria aeruginascens]|nr:hypothetical protein B7494_g6736 [Chlorociboria aeruginascens]